MSLSVQSMQSELISSFFLLLDEITNRKVVSLIRNLTQRLSSNRIYHRSDILIEFPVDVYLLVDDESDIST